MKEDKINFRMTILIFKTLSTNEDMAQWDAYFIISLKVLRGRVVMDLDN